MLVSARQSNRTSGLPRRRVRPVRRWLALAGVIAVVVTVGVVSAEATRTVRSSAAAAASGTGLVTPPPVTTPTLPPGVNTLLWPRDFFDDFTGTTLSSTWGKYGYGHQRAGSGSLGYYGLDNVFVSGGNMVLRTQYVNGGWTSAGVSSGRGFAAVRGEWEFRARFDSVAGIGYAFLLYPDDDTWPPEIDMLEGRTSGPRAESTLHYSSSNVQIHRVNQIPDMYQWHTYGVIETQTNISYTLDGQTWASFDTSHIPTKKMWIGFQTGARPCPDTYGCVVGGKPNAQTPASSTVQIDWVAHYSGP